jgi:hypothetical protein
MQYVDIIQIIVACHSRPFGRATPSFFVKGKAFVDYMPMIILRAQKDQRVFPMLKFRMIRGYEITWLNGNSVGIK